MSQLDIFFFQSAALWTTVVFFFLRYTILFDNQIRVYKNEIKTWLRKNNVNFKCYDI